MSFWLRKCNQVEAGVFVEQNCTIQIQTATFSLKSSELAETLWQLEASPRLEIYDN